VLSTLLHDKNRLSVFVQAWPNIDNLAHHGCQCGLLRPRHPVAILLSLFVVAILSTTAKAAGQASRPLPRRRNNRACHCTV
jgi:hypothetical protein